MSKQECPNCNSESTYETVEESEGMYYMCNNCEEEFLIK